MSVDVYTLELDCFRKRGVEARVGMTFSVESLVASGLRE